MTATHEITSTDPALATRTRIDVGALLRMRRRHRWVYDDPGVLQRIADALRGHPATCRSVTEIRGYAHALQVMDVHRKHRCPRYSQAAAVVTAGCS